MKPLSLVALAAAALAAAQAAQPFLAATDEFIEIGGAVAARAVVSPLWAGGIPPGVPGAILALVRRSATGAAPGIPTATAALVT